MKESIREILRGADIEGLIHLGAPCDEYDDEAQHLTAALEKRPSGQLDKVHITALIASIWERQFNLSQEDVQKRLEAFQDVAKKILAL